MSVVERLSTAYLTVRKPVFALFESAPSNATAEADIGYYAAYNDDGNGIKYTGLYRDQSDADKTYILFDSLVADGLPSNNDNKFTTGLNGMQTASMKVKSFTADGNLTVLGESVALGCNQLSIYDNIIVDNISNVDGEYAGDDAGYVSSRVPINISTNDTPKISNVGLSSNFDSTDTKINILDGASGNGYYVGWAIKKNSGEVRIIIEDIDNGDSTHTLTLENSFGSSGTQGITTFNLFNKTNIGWVWHESDQALSAFAFPRDNLSVLDPNAIDGSAPEYANIIVGNITVMGTISSDPNPLKALTLIDNMVSNGNITLTKANITQYSVILIGGSNEYSITLPNTSTLYSGGVQIAYRFLLANISTHGATILVNGADTIEGETSFVIKRKYEKMTLVSYNGGWLIE